MTSIFCYWDGLDIISIMPRPVIMVLCRQMSARLKIANEYRKTIFIIKRKTCHNKIQVSKSACIRKWCLSLQVGNNRKKTPQAQAPAAKMHISLLTVINWLILWLVFEMVYSIKLCLREFKIKTTQNVSTGAFISIREISMKNLKCVNTYLLNSYCLSN